MIELQNIKAYVKYMMAIPNPIEGISAIMLYVSIFCETWKFLSICLYVEHL